ncbi:CUB domain-containing protein 1-like isoform X1 [Thunnus maccoyii]|uniref:CUB domain-containing protein 1-like isoform X1 n=1 Tax=Thunnus maccoyii TaxID=8240 RepID=UPI001C4C524E|nr:CUB domain-containing protein 1-like isoform X1 [Thunnus maccoyii]
MSLSTARVSLQIFFFLTFIVFTVSGVQKRTIAPDRGTTLNISSSQVKGSVCKVCTGSGRSRQCSTSVLLKDNAPVSVEFECSRPQDVFSMEIVRNIECTTKSCNGHIIQADSGSLPLLDFKRKFTWNLKAPTSKAFQIDFTKTGLTQINPSVSCPDRHTYTLQAFQDTGIVALGKYCRTGTISSAQILNQGSFSLEVPAGQKLQNGQFDVSVGEEIKSLAKITLTLPQGTSSSELLSPNYPDSFPDDDVMEWYFQIPAKQTASVQFLNVTQPHCLKKETAVEYHGKGRGALVLTLKDTQPAQNQGDFSLMLRNCEMDRRRTGSPGLSLSIKVSTPRANSAVLCSVDLRKQKGCSLHIKKLRPTSDCKMKMNSVAKEMITVSSDSVAQLSFQDCLAEDLNVTTMSVIGCNQLKDCPKSPVSLLRPSLPSCLPAPLSSVTWHLRPPEHGTVELTSAVPLKQSLPGQPCNESIIKLAEDDGTNIGQFCPQGAIQKVQIHTNVSVTVSRVGGKALMLSPKPVLSASLKKEISERYIFTVSPMKDTPVLLASPGWPVGMKSYSTISWIVSVPPKMEANLMFANLSQPKCSNRHTNIRVQRVGCLEEDYSRREDEEAESEITVPASFYLNMSNCMPERGDFSVITKITLQKSTNLMLTIILSVVAALLVIFIIVLVVVCVVIRKKKKQLNHQVSIYNPNGTSFLPGYNGFPKSRQDNESHVYASIEDTLVYTHLLRKGAEMGVYGEFDTYRPFMGNTDSQKPLVSKDSIADKAEVGVYQPFRYSSQQAPPLPNRPPSHGQTFVDNDIYQTEDQSQEECSPKLGPRLDPEGGN